MLRRLGSAASPEAHLRLVQTCCECGGKDGAADMPRAVLALNAMEEANMLAVASPAVADPSPNPNPNPEPDPNPNPNPNPNPDPHANPNPNPNPYP